MLFFADELAGFEEAWNTNKGDFPGWNQGFDMHGSTGELISFLGSFLHIKISIYF